MAFLLKKPQSVMDSIERKNQLFSLIRDKLYVLRPIQELNNSFLIMPNK